MLKIKIKSVSRPGNLMCFMLISWRNFSSYPCELSELSVALPFPSLSSSSSVSSSFTAWMRRPVMARTKFINFSVYFNGAPPHRADPNVRTYKSHWVPGGRGTVALSLKFAIFFAGDYFSRTFSWEWQNGILRERGLPHLYQYRQPSCGINGRRIGITKVKLTIVESGCLRKPIS